MNNRLIEERFNAIFNEALETYKTGDEETKNQIGGELLRLRMIATWHREKEKDGITTGRPYNKNPYSLEILYHSNPELPQIDWSPLDNNLSSIEYHFIKQESAGGNNE